MHCCCCCCCCCCRPLRKFPALPVLVVQYCPFLRLLPQEYHSHSYPPTTQWRVQYRHRTHCRPIFSPSRNHHRPRHIPHFHIWNRTLCRRPNSMHTPMHSKKFARRVARLCDFRQYLYLAMLQWYFRNRLNPTNIWNCCRPNHTDDLQSIHRNNRHCIWVHPTRGTLFDPSKANENLPAK